jgi:nucleoside-diphosphate-sugar epimerase
VVRPGLVYGRGGNSDLTSLIKRARAAGRAGHWGSGGTLQSYVHVEDLAELYALAVEKAPHGAILHGAVADVSQRELALAINGLIGADERTERLSLEQMLGMNAVTRVALTLTRPLPVGALRAVSSSFTPPPNAGSGISLSLNKRLASARTRELLGWTPTHTDIVHDLELGSYRS